MKMAKCDDNEINEAFEVIYSLNELFEKSDEFDFLTSSDEYIKNLDEIKEKFREIQWSKFILGYQVLVDNCCDKSLTYLEFSPEIKKALEKGD